MNLYLVLGAGVVGFLILAFALVALHREAKKAQERHDMVRWLDKDEKP